MPECKYDNIGTDSALLKRIDEIHTQSPAHACYELREIAREQQIRIERNESHARHQNAVSARIMKEMEQVKEMIKMLGK